MKHSIIIFFLAGICCLSMAQKNNAPFNRPDTTKAIRFYMDSLLLSKPEALTLFSVEHNYKRRLFAIMSDTTNSLLVRREKLMENQQKREEALGKLLTKEQLDKLKQLSDGKKLSPEMKQRWEKRKKEMEDRYKQKEQKKASKE